MVNRHVKLKELLESELFPEKSDVDLGASEAFSELSKSILTQKKEVIFEVLEIEGVIMPIFGG